MWKTDIIKFCDTSFILRYDRLIRLQKSSLSAVNSSKNEKKNTKYITLANFITKKLKSGGK